MRLTWHHLARDLEEAIDAYLALPEEPTPEFHKALANMASLVAFMGGRDNFLRQWAKEVMELHASAYGDAKSEDQHLEAKIALPHAEAMARLINKFADDIEEIHSKEKAALEYAFPQDLEST